MLYRLLNFPAKLALYFYCRRIVANNKTIFKNKGPLLIAANHPNSFLDAIILAGLFKQPIYSLARGDAFVNPFFKKILYSLKMLPVYRLSEGAENLEHNYTTFSSCIDIFKKNGIVLIFSEGKCINEWHLRPLKKGTARLSFDAWSQGIDLKIIPLGINYSSFRLFGKNVFLNFGEIITKSDFEINSPDGKILNDFNLKLKEQLEKLVYEIDPAEKDKVRKIFFIPQPALKKMLLFIPAIIGWVLHAPLYYPIVSSIKKRANDHFDSIVVGLLFVLYPIYLLAIVIATYFITTSFWSLLLLLIIPFTAWSCLQLKKQIK